MYERGPRDCATPLHSMATLPVVVVATHSTASRKLAAMPIRDLAALSPVLAWILHPLFVHDTELFPSSFLRIHLRLHLHSHPGFHRTTPVRGINGHLPDKPPVICRHLRSGVGFARPSLRSGAAGLSTLQREIVCHNAVGVAGRLLPTPQAVKCCLYA